MGKLVRNGNEYNADPNNNMPFLVERSVMDKLGNDIKDTYMKLSDFRTNYGFDLSLAENYFIKIQPNAGFHNSIFRGKDITSKYLDGSLYTSISNGTFDDLYIGDYFIANINGSDVRCRIAGFDMYLNNGDTALTTHHAVIVPDEPLMLSVMNHTDTTSGGYVGSYLYTTNIPIIDRYLEDAFNYPNMVHLIPHREILTNNVGTARSRGYRAGTGQTNNWSWYTVKSCLMSEVEAYGTMVFSSSGHEVGISHHQFPLFSIAPEFLFAPRKVTWLRSVASNEQFCAIGEMGHSTFYESSTNYRVRPFWLIG